MLASKDGAVKRFGPPDARHLAAGGLYARIVNMATLLFQYEGEPSSIFRAAFRSEPAERRARPKAELQPAFRDVTTKPARKTGRDLGDELRIPGTRRGRLEPTLSLDL